MRTYFLNGGGDSRMKVNLNGGEPYAHQSLGGDLEEYFRGGYLG